MLGSALLEVALGLTFIYVLLSLACSGVHEMIAQLLKLRAATLQQGIERLISDPTVRATFYAHPLIKSLTKKRRFEILKRADISYIPPRTFMAAFFSAVTTVGKVANTSTDKPDGAAAQPAAPAASSLGQDALESFEALKTVIKGLPPSDMKTALTTFLQDADKQVEAVKNSVEEWFDSVMSRTSEWYKRRAQVILSVLAVIVTLALNADTIELARSLWDNPTLRATVVVAADNFVDQNETLPERQAALQTVKQELAVINLPIGWTADTTPLGFKNWLLKVAGLLFTMIAVSQGAPFWFDLLRKLVNFRRGK